MNLSSNQCRRVEQISFRLNIKQFLKSFEIQYSLNNLVGVVFSLIGAIFLTLLDCEAVFTIYCIPTYVRPSLVLRILGFNYRDLQQIKFYICILKVMSFPCFESLFYSFPFAWLSFCLFLCVRSAAFLFVCLSVCHCFMGSLFLLYHSLGLFLVSRTKLMLPLLGTIENSIVLRSMPINVCEDLNELISSPTTERFLSYRKYIANHATFPTQMHAITVKICGNFWGTQYVYVERSVHLSIWYRRTIDVLQIQGFSPIRDENGCLKGKVQRICIFWYMASR